MTSPSMRSLGGEDGFAGGGGGGVPPFGYGATPTQAEGDYPHPLPPTTTAAMSRSHPGQPQAYFPSGGGQPHAYGHPPPSTFHPSSAAFGGRPPPLTTMGSQPYPHYAHPQGGQQFSYYAPVGYGPFVVGGGGGLQGWRPVGPYSGFEGVGGYPAPPPPPGAGVCALGTVERPPMSTTTGGQTLKDRRMANRPPRHCTTTTTDAEGWSTTTDDEDRSRPASISHASFSSVDERMNENGGSLELEEEVDFMGLQERLGGGVVRMPLADSDSEEYSDDEGYNDGEYGVERGRGGRNPHPYPSTNGFYSGYSLGGSNLVPPLPPVASTSTLVGRSSTGRTSSTTITLSKPPVKSRRKTTKPTARPSKIPNPVPVSGLNKRSRGRHVPSNPTEVASRRGGNGKVFLCEVDGCGKYFGRSEHLKRSVVSPLLLHPLFLSNSFKAKEDVDPSSLISVLIYRWVRHTRSLHTNEKPYPCPHPNCNKLFSRHDNLYVSPFAYLPSSSERVLTFDCVGFLGVGTSISGSTGRTRSTSRR